MRKERYWSGGKSSSSKRGEKEYSSGNGGGGGGGCMSAMFQLFDFHQFHFPLHHAQPSFKFTSSSFIGEERRPNIPKGTEAPRNSLELTQSPLSSCSFNPKEEDSLHIPMGMQIKTRGENRASVCSEINSSPGTRTPTLVARLMGLDLLPESTSSSPRPSSTLDAASTPNSTSRGHRPRQQHTLRLSGRKSCSDMESCSGTRSMPETPKISLSRRSDVDHYRRPSIHINMENTNDARDHEFDFSRLIRKELDGSEDECNGLSPGHYARQIVKQVKESVCRRSGITDITNIRRDQLVISMQSKHKKTSSSSKNNYCSRALEDSSSSPSCSPRLRFLENNYCKNNKHHDICQTAKPCEEKLAQPRPKAQPQQLKRVLATSEDYGQKVKRATTKTASSSEAMRNKLQEESFVRPSPAARANVVPDKKCKKTPLSNGIRSIGTVPTVLPIKKDPSPPATKIPAKQVHDAPISKNSAHLSSCSNSRHRQDGIHRLTSRQKDDDRLNGTGTATTVAAMTSVSITAGTITTTISKAAEVRYITDLFEYVGIHRNVVLPSSFTTGPSLSRSHHVFSASLFDELESKFHLLSNSDCSVIGLKCNRKLLFDLVDEILFDFLKPYKNFNPSIRPIQKWRLYGHETLGSELIDGVQAKVDRFPRADCHVLEDIDAIIDGDLPALELKTGSRAMEEEGCGLVTEIEGYIWDGLLVQEMAAIFEPYDPTASR